MKRNHWNWILPLFFLFGALIAAAQPGRGPQARPDGDRPQPRDAWNIPGLTEEQQGKIKAINLAFDKEAIVLRNQIGEKEAQIRTLTMQETVDLNKVNPLIESIGALQTTLRKKRVAADVEIRKLLNDEQRLAFDRRPMRRMGPGAGPHDGRGPRKD